MVSIPKSLNQLRHRLTSIRDQVLRTACEVREGHLADVDAQVVIKRGEHFAELHWTLCSFAAQAIRGADDLSGFHAAARQHRTRNPGPVIAPGILVDGWSATELAPHDYRNILVQTALMQIFDQRAE